MIVEIIMYILVLLCGIFYSKMVKFYYEHIDEYISFARKPFRFKNPKVDKIVQMITSVLISSFAIYGLINLILNG